MNKPIRVLQVFARMDRGGAETMIMNLYRSIDRNKVQFDFIVHTQDKCVFDDEIRDLGGNIYAVPKYTGKNHFEYVKSWKQLFKEHPEHKIIHGHVRSTASIYLTIAKKSNLLTIGHSHSTSNSVGVSSIVKFLLQLRIRKVGDYLFACGEEAGKWLYGKSVIDQPNFFILNNGINPNEYRFDAQIRNKIRMKYNLKNKFVIGHVGRFSEEKNHEFIIDVFNEVYKLNNDSILLLIGEGHLKRGIESKVNKLGLNHNIMFLGLQSNVNELLQGMDVYFMPSKFEGLPVTMIEAQASGIHSIISDSITSEVMITDLVKFLSLDMSPTLWAKNILELNKEHRRLDKTQDITDSGYDVNKNAKFMAEFYVDKYSKRNSDCK